MATFQTSSYSFSEWVGLFKKPTPELQPDPTRSVPALFILVRDYGQYRQWSEGALPELGDMAFWQNLGHSSVVAEILGDSPDEIFVIQASYTQGIINKMSITAWHAGYFGHPNPDRR